LRKRRFVIHSVRCGEKASAANEGRLSKKSPKKRREYSHKRGEMPCYSRGKSVPLQKPLRKERGERGRTPMKGEHALPQDSLVVAEGGEFQGSARKGGTTVRMEKKKRVHALRCTKKGAKALHWLKNKHSPLVEKDVLRGGWEEVHSVGNRKREGKGEL